MAALAADAARLSRACRPSHVAAVRRAGLLHDVGLHGVPATILDKPGPLTTTEWERMRLSSYYTERVLARPAALARLGAIAALAHERLDGSGYHRGLSGAAIPATARILAAADTYRAMTEPRPHRPAHSAKAAARRCAPRSGPGGSAADAADAVLAAAGAARSTADAGPAGLTPREVEVLRLIARGASNRPGRRDTGHHFQDRREPHRADLREDRRVDPIGGDAVRTAARPARQLEPLDS